MRYKTLIIRCVLILLLLTLAAYLISLSGCTIGVSHKVIINEYGDTDTNKTNKKFINNINFVDTSKTKKSK